MSVETPAGEGRYDRQELITWWDQEKLGNARFLVVGAGALGNEIIKNLALLGAGSITVIDLDEIERSNLARCVLFREEDAGLAKAPVAARRAMELNPETEVTAIIGDVRSDLGLGAFHDADVILGALDNRDARLYLNECCWKTGTPWVDGAIEGMMGEMRVFLPPEGADYAATLSQQERDGLERRRACTLLPPEKPGDPAGGRVPTTATTSSVVAGMQVQEAVKLIHREEEGYDFGGKGFIFNGMNHDSYLVEYSAGKSEPPPSYDFSQVIECDGDATFAELYREAGEAIDGEVHLVLERDIVFSMSCGRCEKNEDVRRPAKALPDSTLDCPDCGRQRRLDLLHRIPMEREELLAMTPVELGLPPRDVITATNGTDRRILLLAPTPAVTNRRADEGH